MQETPIIDFHTHLAVQAHDAAALRNTLRAADVFGIRYLCTSMGAAFVYEPTAAEVRQANQLTEELCRRHPDRIIGFAYLNPRLDSALDELQRCVDAGMRGIKLWVAAFCDDPVVYPLVERAIETGLPILQHTWSKTTGNLPNESTALHLARLAGRYPEARLVMAHLSGYWQLGVKAARRHRNLFVDVSGGNPVPGMVEAAVGALGAERVIFGSDGPLRSFASQLAKVDGAAILPRARRRIVYDNAAGLLGLPKL